MLVKSRLMKNMGVITRCATLYRDRRLCGTGLCGSQLPYMMELCRAPGITQDELAQRLHVNRSSVTRQMASLEKGEFITRQRCESDRRAIEVYPAEKMTSMLPQMRSILDDWRGELTQALTPEELTTLEALLGRLAERAEEIV